MSDNFFTDNRYFDNKNYPHGFSRHGHFTIREAQLLERCGHTYNDLDSGKRKPVTDDERQFVAVCHGKRMPSNEHEKVWFKYIEHTRHPKRFHTLSGGKPQTDVIEDFTDTEG
ncbi:MAG: macrodomain Ori protein [Sodalis sp. Psp]|nr:macrodomain Ori protein [Sodalis sp. Psp]MCR3756822.1 macrodomain Ori protein [Sodalis sp. Ppy]